MLAQRTSAEGAWRGKVGGEGEGEEREGVRARVSRERGRQRGLDTCRWGAPVRIQRPHGVRLGAKGQTWPRHFARGHKERRDHQGHPRGVYPVRQWSPSALVRTSRHWREQGRGVGENDALFVLDPLLGEKKVGKKALCCSKTSVDTTAMGNGRKERALPRHFCSCDVSLHLELLNPIH